MGSDGRRSKENSRRGIWMTFCQRRKGTRRAGDRAGYVIGGQGKGDLIWRNGQSVAKGNESGASLSWLLCVRHERSDMYSSRPVSAASSLPSVFSPPGCTT
jgi:hypothetical protein